jgi:hypothetical protein
MSFWMFPHGLSGDRPLVCVVTVVNALSKVMAFSMETGFLRRSLVKMLIRKSFSLE